MKHRNFVLLQLVWIIVILALIWLVAIRPAQIPDNTEISPEGQTERQNAVLDGGLRLIGSNTLYPSSYLPHWAGKVYGVKVGGEKPIESYCDPRYLEQWTGKELADEFSAICWCESNGWPTKTNHTEVEKSIGLFQVNVWAHPEYDEEWLKNPVNNISAMLEIYKNEGFGAWYWCSLRSGIDF